MDQRLASETLDNLVTQFSSAWDFLRELVQNSIDAGTSSIDVWTEFDIEAGAESGVITIHVDDFGEGMSEEIIDDQLTQLFSSAKENDLTKIGKFGIGFVSVFALKPKGVLVHTGRAGEFWEIFFHEDLSFTKTRIDGPVEGTQLTVFLEGDRARYAEVVERVLATLKLWCRHSETEISYEDRSDEGGGTQVRVNEEFTVAGDMPTVCENGELQIVLSYSRTPSYGFYNRGLALAVGSDGDDMLGEYAGRFRHIAFKIKSPWLEHTLSRETVMRDEHFDQAMRIAIEEADGGLHEALLAALALLAGGDEWDLDEQARYCGLLRFLVREPDGLLLDEENAQKPILRMLRGGAMSLNDAYEFFEAHGRVLASQEPSQLAEMLLDHKLSILLEVRTGGQALVATLVSRYVRARRDQHWGRRVLKKIGVSTGLENEIVVSPESCARCVSRKVSPSPKLNALVHEMRETLWKAGHKVARITVGEIEGGAQAIPLFVVGDELAEVMLTLPRRRRIWGRLRGREVVIDHRHPHLAEMLQLYEDLPALAVACMSKALCLHDLAPEADDEAIFACADAVVGRGAA